jgi:hypothetical protein
LGSRQALPRDRPCLSLYERIPAGSAKDYDRQFIAQQRSFKLNRLTSFGYCFSRLKTARQHVAITAR